MNRKLLVPLALFLFINGFFVANLDRRPELRAVAERPDFQGILNAVSAVFVVAFALPSFVALCRWQGARRGVVMLCALGAFAIAIETFAVLTGVPYGRFAYGEKIGGKMFGVVPWTVPFAWTPLLLAAAFLARQQGRWFALSVAALTVAFDLVLDPGAVAQGFWRYQNPGLFYGVPLSNFAGWLLSGFTGASLFRFLAPCVETAPRGLLWSALLILWFWTSVCFWRAMIVPTVFGVVLCCWLARDAMSSGTRLADFAPDSPAPST